MPIGTRRGGMICGPCKQQATWLARGCCTTAQRRSGRHISGKWAGYVDEEATDSSRRNKRCVLPSRFPDERACGRGVREEARTSKFALMNRICWRALSTSLVGCRGLAHTPGSILGSKTCVPVAGGCHLVYDTSRTSRDKWCVCKSSLVLWQGRDRSESRCNFTYSQDTACRSPSS